MKKQGYEVSVVYGIFTPSRPREYWDERWSKCNATEFTHFWLSSQEKYFDFSCFQFGETSPLKVPCSDKRYTQLGYMELETKKLINTGNMLIEWESLREENGVPVLRVVPIFV